MTNRMEPHSQLLLALSRSSISPPRPRPRARHSTTATSNNNNTNENEDNETRANISRVQDRTHGRCRRRRNIQQLGHHHQEEESSSSLSSVASIRQRRNEMQRVQNEIHNRLLRQDNENNNNNDDGDEYLLILRRNIEARRQRLNYLRSSLANDNDSSSDNGDEEERAALVVTNDNALVVDEEEEEDSSSLASMSPLQSSSSSSSVFSSSSSSSSSAPSENDSDSNSFTTIQLEQHIPLISSYSSSSSSGISIPPLLQRLNIFDSESEEEENDDDEEEEEEVDAIARLQRDLFDEVHLTDEHLQSLRYFESGDNYYFKEEEEEQIACPVCQSIHPPTKNKEQSYNQQQHTTHSKQEDGGLVTASIQKYKCLKVYVSAPCPICLEEKVGPPIVALPCGHVLCVEDFMVMVTGERRRESSNEDEDENEVWGGEEREVENEEEEDSILERIVQMEEELNRELRNLRQEEEEEEPRQQDSSSYDDDDDDVDSNEISAERQSISSTDLEEEDAISGEEQGNDNNGSETRRRRTSTALEEEEEFTTVSQTEQGNDNNASDGHAINAQEQVQATSSSSRQDLPQNDNNNNNNDIDEESSSPPPAQDISPPTHESNDVKETTTQYNYNENNIEGNVPTPARQNSIAQRRQSRRQHHQLRNRNTLQQQQQQHENNQNDSSTQLNETEHNSSNESSSLPADAVVPTTVSSVAATVSTSIVSTKVEGNDTAHSFINSARPSFSSSQVAAAPIASTSTAATTIEVNDVAQSKTPNNALSVKEEDGQRKNAMGEKQQKQQQQQKQRPQQQQGRAKGRQRLQRSPRGRRKHQQQSQQNDTFVNQTEEEEAIQNETNPQLGPPQNETQSRQQQQRNEQRKGRQAEDQRSIQNHQQLQRRRGQQQQQLGNLDSIIIVEEKEEEEENTKVAAAMSPSNVSTNTPRGQQKRPSQQKRQAKKKNQPPKNEVVQNCVQAPPAMNEKRAAAAGNEENTKKQPFIQEKQESNASLNHSTRAESLTSTNVPRIVASDNDDYKDGKREAFSNIETEKERYKEVKSAAVMASTPTSVTDQCMEPTLDNDGDCNTIAAAAAAATATSRGKLRLRRGRRQQYRIQHQEKTKNLHHTSSSAYNVEIIDDNDYDLGEKEPSNNNKKSCKRNGGGGNIKPSSINWQNTVTDVKYKVCEKSAIQEQPRKTDLSAISSSQINGVFTSSITEKKASSTTAIEGDAAITPTIRNDGIAQNSTSSLLQTDTFKSRENIQNACSSGEDKRHSRFKAWILGTSSIMSDETLKCGNAVVPTCETEPLLYQQQSLWTVDMDNVQKYEAPIPSNIDLSDARIIGDGVGGIWIHSRSDNGNHGSRIDDNGKNWFVLRITPDENKICCRATFHRDSQIVSDGLGGLWALCPGRLLTRLRQNKDAGKHTDGKDSVQQDICRGRNQHDNGHSRFKQREWQLFHLDSHAKKICVRTCSQSSILIGSKDGGVWLLNSNDKERGDQRLSSKKASKRLELKEELWYVTTKEQRCLFQMSLNTNFVPDGEGGLFALTHQSSKDNVNNQDDMCTLYHLFRDGTKTDFSFRFPHGSILLHGLQGSLYVHCSSGRNNDSDTWKMWYVTQEQKVLLGDCPRDSMMVTDGEGGICILQTENTTSRPRTSVWHASHDHFDLIHKNVLLSHVSMLASGSNS